MQQPLALPLLAYIVLSALSTILSPEPQLSWGYMKLVCYTAMVATLFAQNLTRLSQVRVLVVLLLLSATAAAAFTAWQYTYGIGVRVDWVDAESQLFPRRPSSRATWSLRLMATRFALLSNYLLP